MKKKNTPQPTFVYPEKILQEYEDATLKKAETLEKSFHEDNLEAFMLEVQDYSRAELIQALREARNQADEFALWLIRKNRSQSEIANEIHKRKLNEKNSKEKRAKRRSEQSKEDMRDKVESKNLGVDNVYELIQKAITIYDQWDEATKKQYSIETIRIRKIIVDLLCQPNVSIHTYTQEQWAEIVDANILSSHIGTAKTSLKRALKKAT
jgi:hypothetical protein